ncbi:MAG TPA: hypothetical protein VLK65_17690 [Vicinamibacteria bacterium]|nr:hypothetical protein [Vicinamibacteria bacterium]
MTDTTMEERVLAGTWPFNGNFLPLLEKYYYDLSSDKSHLEQLGIAYPTVRQP